MKAIILAAGRGTRLRPLTDARPKCMVELDGVPLLDIQVAALRAAGIQDITVVAGYCASAITTADIKLVKNFRYQTTNMVSSLACAARDLLAGEDVVVSYGDIVCEPKVIAAVMAGPDPVSVVVDTGWREYWERRFTNPLDDAETLRLRGDGTIADIGRRPKSLDEIEAQYIGLFKVSAGFAPRWMATYESVCNMDPRSVDAMYMTEFLQLLIDNNFSLHAVRVHHGWLEIDHVSDLRLYESGGLRGLYENPQHCGRIA